MIKFFRNIRLQTVTGKQPESRSQVIKYLLYAVGEIMLVVIGILIALQINNWNTLKIEDKEEIQTYKQIKRQLLEDQKEVIQTRDLNNYHSIQFGKAIQIISSDNRAKIDSLAILTMGLSSYSDFNGSGRIYETLVNSGDIKLLKNTSITNGLQKLEMTYSYTNKLEDIHWEIIMQELSPEVKGVINYKTLGVVKPEKLYGVELQNIFIECVYLIKAKDTIYNKCLTEMGNLLDLLDQEIQSKNDQNEKD